MAKVLSELPKKQGGIGRTPKYDYSKYLDGQVWQLTRGDLENDPEADFDSTPESMRANLNNAASNSNLKIKTRIIRIPEFEVDENGNQVTDDEGNPVQMKDSEGNLVWEYEGLAIQAVAAVLPVSNGNGTHPETETAAAA